MAQFAPKNLEREKWDLVSLKAWLNTTFGLEWDTNQDEIRNAENLEDRLKESIQQLYEKRRGEWGIDRFQAMHTSILLHVMDTAWVEHLTYLEQLRKGIFLRAYGQKDPLIEFQKEGFRLFESMMARVEDTALEYIFRMSTAAAPEQRPNTAPQIMTQRDEQPASTSPMLRSNLPATEAVGTKSAGIVPLPARSGASEPVTVEKIGRNDPCFCGSGKKYKKCHGK